MMVSNLARQTDRPRPAHPGRLRAQTSGTRRRIGKVALAVFVLLGSTVSISVFLAGGGSTKDEGPRLVHTISRGDLTVTVVERGILESSENEEIKNKVRGKSTVLWVVDSGTLVQPGDVLVQLDTLALEEFINERTKYAHWSRSSAERLRANVRAATLRISQYIEGTFPSQLATLEKDRAIAEANLRTAKNMHLHAQSLAQRGYVSELDLENRRFAVIRADLSVEVKETEIKALQEYQKELRLEELNGALKTAEANLEAAEERSKMDGTRRDLAKEELDHCVVRAERAGMVIHPSAARWKNAPEIAEGIAVHKDQTLLLMPDLSKMQVKLGIPEAKIVGIEPGLTAIVTLPEHTLEGEVATVASVTSPANWSTGNVARYETEVKLPSVAGLRPGMSADVEIIVSHREDVLTIPVAAVVEADENSFCWVKTEVGVQRKQLTLGDTDGAFSIIETGLNEGDQVVLNPTAYETFAGDAQPQDAGASPPTNSTKSKSDPK